MFEINSGIVHTRSSMTGDKRHHSNQLATFKVDASIPLARLRIVTRLERLFGILVSDISAVRNNKIGLEVGKSRKR